MTHRIYFIQWFLE